MENANNQDPQKGSRFWKVVLLVCVLIFAYLFLLNGRYYYDDGGYIFDKWKKELIYSLDLVKD